MAFVCVYVCARTCCQSTEETRGETRGVRRRPGERERERDSEGNSGGKPLTAVAQGSGFLCPSRKTTMSGASRKTGGILSRFCLQDRRPMEQVLAQTHSRPLLLKLQQSGRAFI